MSSSAAPSGLPAALAPAVSAGEASSLAAAVSAGVPSASGGVSSASGVSPGASGVSLGASGVSGISGGSSAALDVITAGPSAVTFPRLLGVFSGGSVFSVPSAPSGFTNPDPYSEGSHLEEGDPNEDGADQDEDEDDDEARERARLLAEFHDAKDALQELKDERDRRRAQDEVLLDIILARRRRPFVLRSCRNWRRWIARRLRTVVANIAEQAGYCETRKRLVEEAGGEVSDTEMDVMMYHV